MMGMRVMVMQTRNTDEKKSTGKKKHPAIRRGEKKNLSSRSIPSSHLGIYGLIRFWMLIAPTTRLKSESLPPS
jgi:hypothetical protein